MLTEDTSLRRAFLSFVVMDGNYFNLKNPGETTHNLPPCFSNIVGMVNVSPCFNFLLSFKGW